MKIKWMFQRVRAMSAIEVAERLRGRIRFERLRGLSQPFPMVSEPALAFSIVFETDFPKDIREAVLRKADILLNGTRVFFGRTFSISSHASTGEEDWHKDPFTGKSWPLKYFLDIDYRRTDAPGDPKIIWELNRHQYLVPVALAYSWTGIGKYRDFAVHCILDWIRENPPLLGINWVSPMEAGIRLMSWVMALSIMGRDALSMDEQAAIAAGMAVQASFIAANLSRHSSANNHLIGELTGLLAASRFMKSEAVEKWENIAVSELKTQISRQFHPDGVCCEQSINYQCHTMDYYLIAEGLCRQENRTLGHAVCSSLEKGVRFLTDISDEDWTSPHIGDEDDGWIAPVLGEKRKIESTVGLAAAVLGISPGERPIPQDSRSRLFSCPAAVQSEKTALAEKPTGSGRTAHAEKPTGSGKTAHAEKTTGSGKTANISMKAVQREERNLWTVYPVGGYAICHYHPEADETDEGIVVFDFGPIGQHPLRAHGHADLLSVHVSWRGKPFLIDPGTYVYYGNDGLRQYFRGTSAHNTVCVDGRNQLQSLGRFQWGREPAVEWSRQGPAGITASHDGYVSSLGIRHQRALSFSGAVLQMTDHLRRCRGPKGQTNFSIAFHLHPDVTLTREGTNSFVLDNRGAVLQLHFPAALRVSVHRGEETLFSGWYSENFYSIVPATTLVVEGMIGVEFEHTVNIVFSR